jgi:capsular exopolysaccharide synthesis family protein
MGKIFEALKKAEKERVKLIKKAGQDPSALAHGDGEVDPHLVAYFDRMSPITEQYRSLKTNIAALHEDNPPKAIVFTSANAGEGKTTTALNLAVTLADDRETRVVVVDADLRRPRVHMMLGLDNNKGLADYLTGNVMLELVLQRSRLPNLHVLPAGRLPGNPTELLAGKKMDDLFERLTRDFAHVLVDAPAISRHTDAAVLASKTDGAVLVLKMRETPKKDVLRATDLLQKARVNLLGTVLTHINPVMKDYYYSAAAV